MRVGHGFDAHRFESDVKLVLGGVHIEYDKGLAAHSDGDVVIHALCDALIGAAGLGDIGQHFPDTDTKYQNIDSRVLLRHVMKRLQDRSFRVVNVDLTIVAQKPRLSAYLPRMRELLADDLALQPDEVNIKATTTERMGFTGREEGIAVHVVALIDEL